MLSLTHGRTTPPSLPQGVRTPRYAGDSWGWRWFVGARRLTFGDILEKGIHSLLGQIHRKSIGIAQCTRLSPRAILHAGLSMEKIPNELGPGTLSGLLCFGVTLETSGNVKSLLQPSMNAVGDFSIVRAALFRCNSRDLCKGWRVSRAALNECCR